MKLRNLTIVVALGLATAAFAAAPGQATHPNDEAGPLGVGPRGAIAVKSVRPDDRAVRVSPAPKAEAPVRPDDRATRPTGRWAKVEPAADGSTFTWSDAGGGLILFAILAALGAALVWSARYQRRSA